MKVLRIGTILLLTGLILLPYTLWYSPGKRGSISRTVKQNNMLCYTVIAPPVGTGVITVDTHRVLYNVTDLPVHIEIVDPRGRVLVNQDTITPQYFEVNFRIRGVHKVNVTNRGTEKASIAVGVIFEGETSAPKDKILIIKLSIALGTALILADIVKSLTRSKKQIKQSL